MKFTEKYGASIDEAIKLALLELHTTIDKVKVTVIQEPAKVFFGIGSKLAKVRVEIIEPFGISQAENIVDCAIDTIKLKMPNATEKDIADAFTKLAEPAADLEHLDEDGELPWGWHTYHDHEFTDQIESKFNYFRTQWIVSRNSGSPQEECAALKSLLLYMDDAQRASDRKGECYSFWCSEYLINQEWKKDLQYRLEYLEGNMDKEMAEYHAKIQYEKQCSDFAATITDDDILEAIKQNSGMLQKNFYKLFDDPCAKDVISEKLYYMAKEGKIERTKSGNSYILKIK